MNYTNPTRTGDSRRIVCRCQDASLFDSLRRARAAGRLPAPSRSCGGTLLNGAFQLRKFLTTKMTKVGFNNHVLSFYLILLYPFLSFLRTGGISKRINVANTNESRGYPFVTICTS